MARRRPERSVEPSPNGAPSLASMITWASLARRRPGCGSSCRESDRSNRRHAVRDSGWTDAGQSAYDESQRFGAVRRPYGMTEQHPFQETTMRKNSVITALALALTLGTAGVASAQGVGADRPRDTQQDGGRRGPGGRGG